MGDTDLDAIQIVCLESRVVVCSGLTFELLMRVPTLSRGQKGSEVA